MTSRPGSLRENVGRNEIKNNSGATKETANQNLSVIMLNSLLILWISVASSATTVRITAEATKAHSTASALRPSFSRLSRNFLVRFICDFLMSAARPIYGGDVLHLRLQCRDSLLQASSQQFHLSNEGGIKWKGSEPLPRR